MSGKAIAKQESVKADLIAPGVIKRAKEVDGRLVELRGVIEKSYSEVGKLLYEVENKRLHTALGYETFDEYVEDRMKFKARKGFYLKAIYEKLVVVAGASEADVAEVDWTKAREVAKVATKGNVKRLLGVAKTETVENVKKAVEHEAERTGKSSAGGEAVDVAKEKVFIERIGLYEEQHKLWERALKIAAEVGKTDKRPRMIELICMEFLSSRLDDLGREKHLKWWLQRLESAFGVKLVAVDPTKDEVVYGKKLMEMMEKTAEEETKPA